MKVTSDMDGVKKLAKTLGFKTVDDDINSIIKDYYRTSCKPLDIILGDGLPGGRLIELFGKPSEGKSTIALEFTKSFTNYWKNKGEEYYILWIESESVFDKMRAKWIGCDISRFLITEAATVEDGLEAIGKTIDAAKAGKFKLFVVWDTIAATITTSQKASGTLFSGGIAEKPRIIFQALRNLVQPMGEVGVTVVLVNQVYSLIGGNGGYESPGGFGIKFFSSIRLCVRIAERIMSDDNTTMVAIKSEVETIKNKITTPRQKIKLYIHGEKGFDAFNTLYDYCVDNKIIEVKGSWKYVHFHKFNPTTNAIDTQDVSFQNTLTLREAIKKNPDILDFMDFKVVESRSKISPFMKVRLIEELWKYEKIFFGEVQTSLTTEEVELAELEKIEIQKQDAADILAAPGVILDALAAELPTTP